MRGRPASHFRGSNNLRNTPAYAGKTVSIPTTTPKPKKHPRICGEDHHIHHEHRHHVKRNTPAYAGKTARALQTPWGSQKHPRICGEDAAQECLFCISVETPPHMRGRHAVRVRNTDNSGNTPAYAGKTQWRKGRVLQWKKHPRICGEDASLTLLSSHAWKKHPRICGEDSKKI